MLKEPRVQLQNGLNRTKEKPTSVPTTREQCSLAFHPLQVGKAGGELQTKHQINRTGSLTDASPDVWKTLRIWSEATKRDPSFPTRTRLALVTTGLAPADSAAAQLRPESIGSTPRNPEAAAAKLEKVAAESTNRALKPAFDAFLSLAPATRHALLGAIEVLDQAPTLNALDSEIEDALRLLGPRGQIALRANNWRGGGIRASLGRSKRAPARSLCWSLSKSSMIFAS